jgi:hypothetical protein
MATRKRKDGTITPEYLRPKDFTNPHSNPLLRRARYARSLDRGSITPLSLDRCLDGTENLFVQRDLVKHIFRGSQVYLEPQYVQFLHRSSTLN